MANQRRGGILPSQKTPWNPSKRAIKRVRNPLPVPDTCIHCQSSVQAVHHNEIYGRPYGKWPWAYQCSGCAAYVGMHPFTHIPLGTLATPAIRKSRMECKIPFEKLYRSGKISRGEAYSRLARKLSIKEEECHFAWFDVEMCHRARKASMEIDQEL